MVPRVTRPGIAPSRHVRRWYLAASAFATCLLYRFPPETYPFYPSCPVYQLTGLLCPGCGATRAMEALLHGHLQHALSQNALIVVLLPVLAIYMARSWRAQRWYPVSSGAKALLFAGTFLFTVSRNLHTV